MPKKPFLPYKQPSKHWISSPKLLFFLLILGVIFLIAWLMPVILRTRRSDIHHELAVIQDTKTVLNSSHEIALQKLFRATGGDREVGEVLAQYYLDKHQYQSAARVYETTHPAQVLAAIEAHALSYDYASIEKLTKKLPKNQLPDAIKWRILANINLEKAPKGCKLVNQASGTDKPNLDALCEITRQSNLDANMKQRAKELGGSVWLAAYVTQQDTKTTSDWLLLADVAERQGDKEAATANLEQAFSQDPWNREVVDSLIAWCSNEQNVKYDDCPSLLNQAQRQRELLLNS